MQRKGFPICPYYAIRAHIFGAGPAKRSRCQNPLRHAGPLLGGVYAEHVYPRHNTDEAGCGRHHRSGDQQSNVRREEFQIAAPGRNSCPVLFRPFGSFPRVGQLVGRPKTPETNRLKKVAKNRENPPKLYSFGGSMSFVDKKDAHLYLGKREIFLSFLIILLSCVND